MSERLSRRLEIFHLGNDIKEIVQPQKILFKYVMLRTVIRNSTIVITTKYT